MPKKPDLSQPSELFRSQVAKGIKGDDPVDREGGDYGAGLVRGVAVITRGEALGHDEWIDGEMLRQVSDAIQESEMGIKSRFTHPDMSGDGLGKFLGRFKNSHIDGDIVRADLHLAESAHESPDGNLAKYVMDLAEEDPEAFATSIAFRRDMGAEDAFIGQNSDENGRFTSPDPDNKNNYPHVRLHQLRAVDTVDEPAANPGGLFGIRKSVAGEAEKILSFCLGLTSEKPTVTAFDVDPTRVAGFVSRYLERNGITLKQGEPMTTETTTPETPDTNQPETSEFNKEVAMREFREQLQRFQTEFGNAQGAAWFQEGLSYQEACDRHRKQLQAENEQLKQKLAAVELGETEPVTQGGEPETTGKTWNEQFTKK